MDAMSIGIIGGADGPTAVFVTGDFGWCKILLIGAVIALGIAAAIRWKKKH